MGCCDSLSKCFLVTFNMIFLLFGGGCLAGGIYILVDKNEILVLTRSATSSLNTDVASPSLLEKAAYALIAGGGAVFIVAFLGCCGACLRNKKMLVLYAIIVGALVALEIAAVALCIVYKGDFETYAKDNLKKLQQERYKGPYDTTDAVSLAFDVVHILFECCGVESGQEYNTTVPGFNTTYAYTNGGTYTVATAYIPLTCCQFSDKSKFPSDIQGFISSMKNSQCPVTTTDSYANTGCYTSLKDYLMKYLNIVIGIGGGIVALELFGIIASCVLIKTGKVEEEKEK